MEGPCLTVCMYVSFNLNFSNIREEIKKKKEEILLPSNVHLMKQVLGQAVQYLLLKIPPSTEQS